MKEAEKWEGGPIAVIGARGQLGFELMRLLPKNLAIGWSRKEVDITDFPQVRQVLSHTPLNVLINTAAYHRTDECEEHPELAFRVTSFAVANLASLCRERGIVFVHISTDYVFDGEKREPYKEEDPVNPLNVYGMSKMLGEEAIKILCPKHFIIRTSGMFGRIGSTEKGGSFLHRMLARAKEGNPLKIVKDQWFSPTYASHLAKRILELIPGERYGTYHITNSGETNWYEFARTAVEMLGWEARIEPVHSEELPARARRPRFSVLSNEKIHSLGFPPLPHWKEALKEFLSEWVP
ncbi:MAG: dTDP-4-dehydrorhamnose reductase [bacterium]